jgi:cytochrome P450
VSDQLTDLTLDEWMHQYHPSNPDLQDDPHPLFDRLRAELPVARSEVAGGFWVFSRYDDVHYILQHPEVFSNAEITVPAYHDPDGPQIPEEIDPPDHAKYRQIMAGRFAPGAVNDMEVATRESAVRLIDRIVAKGTCDFITEFAVPLPAEIFCTMMGMPLGDLDRLLDWKDRTLRAVLGDDPAELLQARASVQREVKDYFQAIYRARTASRQPGDDLMGVLITGRFGGERNLTESEFVRTCAMIYLAGLDTVTAQLAFSILYLGRHLEARDALVGEPSLIPAAVEEFLRHDPIATAGRIVVQDCEVGGVPLRPGDRVYVLITSANRDETQFDHAADVDFHRPVNRHLAFGAGPHRCIGSHLARMEMRVALEEIHRRMPTYRVDESVPVIRHYGYVAGVDQLHLLID